MPTTKPDFETTLADRDTAEETQALIWGPSKAGKTVLAGSFPKPLFVDYDDGMESIKTAIRKGWIDQDEEDVRFTTFYEEEKEEFGYVKNPTALENSVDFVNYWLQDERHDEWETLVLDSVTSMCNYAINQALKNLNKLESYTDSFSKSSRVSMRIMARQDWGPAMSLVENIIDEMREKADLLGKHLVIIAHEHHETTDSGAILTKEPHVIGQVLRQHLPNKFDEVWYLSRNKSGDRVLQTEETNRVVAGSRLGVPDGLEDPTYKRIMESIQ